MCVNVSNLLVFVIFISSTSAKYRYDYIFNKEANGWLKVHHTPATFEDAYLRCDAEGAVLASPLNDELRKALIKVHPRSKQNCGIYTGLHSTISPGDYTSVEGIPLARIKVTWAPNEPDNYDNQENCLIMLSDGALADVRCNETFSYVCYKKKTKNIILSECGTIDNEYKLEKRTGSCYKFHRVGMSWRRAQMTCLAEGGHLAIINSPTEATVLKELFAQHPSNTISAQHHDVAALGFLDWNHNRMWYTVHGQKIEEAGFSTFSNGQPDNATYLGQGSFCGAMFRSGLLDDVWCDDFRLVFICEKTPESLAEDDEAKRK